MKDKLVNSLYVENQIKKFVKELKLKFRNQITSRKKNQEIEISENCRKTGEIPKIQGKVSATIIPQYIIELIYI